jgi:hypothetical protein
MSLSLRLPGLRRRVSLLAASLLCAGLVAASQAPAQALSISPALHAISPGNVGGDSGFSGSLGYNFNLSQPYAVSALGFYDELGDGLLSSHMVGIFDATSQALLISGTVPSGSSSPLLAGFRWLSVPQQVLNAGSYVIAATSSGDPASFDPFIFEGFDPVVSAGFSLGTASLAQAGSGSIVAFPNTDEGLPYGFFGPNFASQPVPGPLPVLGVAGSLAWSRRLRCRLRANRHAASRHAASRIAANRHAASRQARA